MRAAGTTPESMVGFGQRATGAIARLDSRSTPLAYGQHVEMLTAGDTAKGMLGYGRIATRRVPLRPPLVTSSLPISVGTLTDRHSFSVPFFCLCDF